MKTKKILSCLLSAILMLCFATFCVGAAETDEYSYDMEYYSKLKGKNVTIYVYNWGEYIADGGDGSMNVIREFERITGINVEYTTFDSNESLYAKLKSGSASYDVIIPSDYMVSRLIQEDMVQKIDYSNVPNFEKYIDEEFRSPEYDPTNEYSVPYTWGTVGIIYNTKYVDEADVSGWDMLWNEKYVGKILMFDNSRDAFAISLKRLGYSMNSSDAEELKEAAEELSKQSSIVQAYVMDQIFDKMVEENAYIAPYYAGDYLTMVDENEDLAFIFPEEGTNLFTDAMCIPSTSKNKEAAEMFINFMCEPLISGENCNIVGYSTPISAAKEYLDEDLVNSEIAYPSQDILDKTERYINLSGDTNQLMDDLWVSTVRTNSLSASFWIAVVVICVVVLVIVFRNMYIKKKRMEARLKY